MNHFSKRLGAILVGVAVAIPAFAEIPVNLRGTWVIDTAATTAVMKKSAEWNEEAEQMLPMMQRMWSSMAMTITADSMTASRGKKKEDTVTADLVSTKKTGHILKITDKKGKVTRAAFQLLPKDRFRILMGKKDDEKSPIWKKGKPSQDVPSNLEMMAEVMSLASQSSTKADNTAHSMSAGKPKTTVNKPSAKPARAPKSKDPVVTEDFKHQFGRLEITRLTDESIKAINAIEKKKGLKVRIKKGCSQESFNRLASLPWITNLTIGHFNVTIDSFAPLSSLKSLTSFTALSLKASRNSPIDLGPLTGLSELQKVSFSGTSVTNTQALSGLAKLKDVSLRMSSADSIDFLKTTPAVEVLNLYGFGHTFKDYTPLLSLPKLKSLDIDMNKQATDEALAPLAAMTSLEEIDMSSCRRVTSLAFLAGSKGIQEIKASKCRKLVDLSALADKADLEHLNIGKCPAEDFSSLRGKTKIKHLSLSGTSFSDLSIIGESKELNTLSINETKVVDLTPLQSFTQLKRVAVPTSVSSAQIDTLKKALPNLRIDQ